MAEKPIFLVPMAGRGERFRKAGILEPKQLLPVGEISCLARSLDSFTNLDAFTVVFGVCDERVGAAAMAYAAARGVEAQLVTLGETAAPTETLKLMIERARGLDPAARVYVYTMDIEVYPAVAVDAGFEAGGVTYVFTSSTPSYSYVKLDDGVVTDIAEKKVISRHANIGLYGFRRLDRFKAEIDRIEAARAADAATGKPHETHVSSVIKTMLADSRFEIRGVEGVHVFGTPQEYDFFTRYILPQRGRRRIALFSDHSGFAAKMRFIAALTEAGFEPFDCGAFDAEMSNYPPYAQAAIDRLVRGEADLIFGFCRTGQGACISLNKMAPEVLSAVIYDENAMEFALAHNCARGFCFPENIWLERDLTPVIECLRTINYEGGRHTDRLRQVVRRYLTPEQPVSGERLDQFKGGWLVGDFMPTLVPTRDVEVAVKLAPKDQVPDGHFHKLGIEHTVILTGKAEDKGRLYGPGEIVTLHPMERNYTRFLEDSLLLCIKTPSVKGDKYD